MKHSQDDPRRSLRPPDGGRDDLLGEVMRKKRHRPDLSGSKQELSRLAGSGGSVLRIGINPHLLGNSSPRSLYRTGWLALQFALQYGTGRNPNAAFDDVDPTLRGGGIWAMRTIATDDRKPQCLGNWRTTQFRAMPLGKGQRDPWRSPDQPAKVQSRAKSRMPV